MKSAYYWIMALFLYGCTGNQDSMEFPRGKWIDLTHAFSEETIYWPTSPTFELDTIFVGYTERDFYYTAFSFCTAEHGGTHVDAPIHFAEGKHSVDEIPVEQLIGAAVVMDVSEKALKDQDYQVQINDFTAWERENGRIADGSIVLLRTGYGQFWPDRQKYMGTEERGEEAVAKLHFPGLHPEAAQWLVEDRNIAAIGLDTPSIDYGQSQLFESHQILFKANIPAFENVANLDQLPQTGSWVFALPMKIKGGSGGPLRIVALVPEC